MEDDTKDKLVKIDEVVYNAMKEYVAKNKLEYPSMKYFVEKAIVYAMGFKKYDIEGTSDTYDEKAPLKSVVGDFNRSLAMCFVCNRSFLRDPKDNSEISRVCPNCKNTISHFAPHFIKQQNDANTKEKPTKAWHKLIGKK